MYSSNYLRDRRREAFAHEGVFIPQRPTIWRAIKKWIASYFRNLVRAVTK